MSIFDQYGSCELLLRDADDAALHTGSGSAVFHHLHLEE